MYAAVQHAQDVRPSPAPPKLAGEALSSPGRPVSGVVGAAGWSSGEDARPAEAAPATAGKPRELVIQGITSQGRAFRPSDWAERLAGAMSCFRPGGGAGGISAAIGYSPYCFPRVIDGVKCVLVSEQLRALEPMAWHFVLDFARDNDLRLVDAAAPPG